ncbi:MAG: hypothetical protein R3D82_18620 [Xanthobacteraceae bacterium]|nr:hypothetical protein [Bradyrhizobium sp.]
MQQRKRAENMLSCSALPTSSLPDAREIVAPEAIDLCWMRAPKQTNFAGIQLLTDSILFSSQSAVESHRIERDQSLSRRNVGFFIFKAAD